MGFRRNCCTLHHITNFETVGEVATNNKETVAVVFLNLTKTYDSTWLTGLIYKLARREVRGKCLRWIRNFVTDRTMAVKVEDAILRRRTKSKGVPQGCVLSPTLFKTMIADFP